MRHKKMETKPESSLSCITIKQEISEQFSDNLHERYWPRPARASSAPVFKSLQIGFIGLFLCIASVWAGPGSIQGIVKDAKGQPIKGADVRVESRDGKQLFSTVKTDAKGGYAAQGLRPGVYRVTLLVNGATKASIMNTNTKPDQATQLNFDLKPASASRASTEQKKGKRMVWVPAQTGSHTGGRWVEVDEGGAAAADELNVKSTSAEQARQ